MDKKLCTCPNATGRAGAVHHAAVSCISPWPPREVPSWIAEMNANAVRILLRAFR